MTNRPTLDSLMQSMPVKWRYLWCSSGACGCLGCANRSGGLTRHGYSKKDYDEWLTKNPKVNSNV